MSATARSRRTRLGVLSLMLVALALAAPGGASASECARFASPAGDDGASGAAEAPYRSVRQLTLALGPGETGCLRSGSYWHDDVAYLDAPGAVLRSYPGEEARVDGPIWITGGARGAQVRDLRLTSSSPTYPMPLKVQADDAVVADNEITSAGNATCVMIGSTRVASRILIEGNYFHACGDEGRWDHVLYLSASRGAVIRWNVIADNQGGWAVHLYEDADETLIEHNVIDGNMGGVVFGGEDAAASELNEVRYNAITFSGPVRNSINYYWGSFGMGRGGNGVHDNCLYTPYEYGPSGLYPEQPGWSAQSNAELAGSPYQDRGAGDYRLVPGSPCEGLVGDTVARVPKAPGPRTPASSPPPPASEPPPQPPPTPPTCEPGDASGGGSC